MQGNHWTLPSLFLDPCVPGSLCHFFQLLDTLPLIVDSFRLLEIYCGHERFFSGDVKMLRQYTFPFAKFLGWNPDMTGLLSDLSLLAFYHSVYDLIKLKTNFSYQQRKSMGSLL